jgi:putative CocE/NonD family hydrolase
MFTSLHSLALQLRPTRSRRSRDRLRGACILLPLAAACSGVDRSDLAAGATHDPSATESWSGDDSLVTELPLQTGSLDSSDVASGNVDTGDVEPGPIPSSNVDTDSVEPDGTPAPAAINTAFYLPMRDGVRIAVDLWLPGGAAPGQRFPSIVRATRYWRELEVRSREAYPETDREVMAKSFVQRGYAYLTIDARGTGSSFGPSAQPWSPREIADYGEIVEWLQAQPWSNGRVGAFGISYDSNTAEMMATAGNAGVQAVIPRFGYPNVYSDVMFPGGVYNQLFMQAWLERGRVMDANDLCTLEGVSGADCEGTLTVVGGVKPVDADSDGLLQAAALAEHAQGPDEFAALSLLSCSDERWDGADFASLSPGSRGARAEATGTPFMAWASWMDLGTARGALNRWAAYDVPMQVIIGPWNHDASTDANPYQPKDAPLELGADQQRAMELSFFDHYLKGEGEPLARKIVYYTLGENVWKETPVWPPAGTRTTSLYLREDGALSELGAAATEAPDSYLVDFSASTGAANGWWTKYSGKDVFQGDRRSEDEKLLVYTSAPLDSDTELTGHAQVTLHLASTETDGSVFVYLEDVAPDGSVTYLTEGELRLLHRKACAEPASFDVYGPCHSFRSEDTEPMPPGSFEEVTIGLHPISALVRAGHSIRVALAGHDASSFARIPATGTPVWSLAHDPEHPSRIELPVATRTQLRVELGGSRAL